MNNSPIRHEHAYMHCICSRKGPVNISQQIEPTKLFYKLPFIIYFVFHSVSNYNTMLHFMTFFFCDNIYLTFIFFCDNVYLTYIYIYNIYIIYIYIYIYITSLVYNNLYLVSDGLSYLLPESKQEQAKAKGARTGCS